MATNILDAFFVTFGLDASGFKKGEREVNESSRRLRDENKRTFDEMEKRGKSLEQTLRGVRNETAGMFLAFMGASSLSGFVSGLLQSTAASTRLGQAIGVASERVRAWRQAVKEVGGAAAVGDADAALSKISQDQQDWHLTGRTSSDANYKRFGITPRDLVDKDASDILLKISAAGDKMQKPEFNRRLQMMGLPQNIINLLMQGHDAVSKAIATGEKNAKVTADQEQAALDLQKNVADLQNTIQNGLIPPLLDIAKGLNQLLGNGPSAADKERILNEAGGSSGHMFGVPGLFSIRRGNPNQDPVTGYAADLLNELRGNKGAGNEGRIYQFFKSKGLDEQRTIGIMAALHAESGLSERAKNPSSGAFGINQWLGGRKRELMRRFGPNPTLMQQLEFLWWELSGGDHGGDDVMSQRSAGGTAHAMINKFLRPARGYETMRDISAANRYIRSRSSGGVHIQSMTIHTQARDAHGIAKDMHRAIARRASITHANTGMTP